MKFQGIVLAGGKSSRFGEDKALALVNGIPMIQKAVRLLVELQLDPCVITSESRDYLFLKCRIEKDLISGRGPLGGLYTAFSLFEQSPLVVLTCDMPLIHREMLRALTQAHSSSHEATLFQKMDGNPEPFPGIYEPRLKRLVKRRLDSNRLSMHELIRNIAQKKILSLPLDPESFVNINSKEDYESIPKKAVSHDSPSPAPATL